MRLVVDLHSHSGYAGGVGDLALDAVATTMAKKGIDVFGTGDVLQPAWREHLRNILIEKEPGLFALDRANSGLSRARFLLQSEIILTAPVPSGGRKAVHVLLLFPSFSAVETVAKAMAHWGVKLEMGRPFLCSQDASEVAEKLFFLKRVDPSILVIPAHVLTPQGIYGSDHPVDRMADFFGEYAKEIRIVETGLSADPQILSLLPELDDRTLISNSDCHGAALNRVGRECTALDIPSPSYAEIVDALCKRRILETIEFTPAEGRYFLTGHRAGKEGHGSRSFCYFSPDTVPADSLCPICKKKLTIGVLQRALELSRAQGASRTLEATTPRQQAIHLVPLVEVIAASLGVKSVTTKKVTSLFEAIVTRVGSEFDLWMRDAGAIEKELAPHIPPRVVESLVAVRKGQFTFDPLGYDGVYGVLTLGKITPWFGQRVIVREEEVADSPSLFP